MVGDTGITTEATAGVMIEVLMKEVLIGITTEMLIGAMKEMLTEIMIEVLTEIMTGDTIEAHGGITAAGNTTEGRMTEKNTGRDRLIDHLAEPRLRAPSPRCGLISAVCIGVSSLI